MTGSTLRFSLITVALAVCLSACTKKADEKSETQADLEEAGQQIGDAMASIDESGSGSGNFAQIIKSETKFFARSAPGSLIFPSPLMSTLFPTATAAACSSVAFGACSSGVTTRTFAGCTVGTAEFNGSVSLTYRDGTTGVNQAGCSLIDTGDVVLRNPNYTVTGLRGAELSVSKTGSSGQSILRLNGALNSYRLDNDGINRRFTLAGQTLLDSTTVIEENASSQPMVISGTNRSGRTLSGGKLTFTNNLTAQSCSFEPSNVTWGASCNCATSGSWAGTCSNGTSATLEITGCGTANLSVGEETEILTFDRCY